MTEAATLRSLPVLQPRDGARDYFISLKSGRLRIQREPSRSSVLECQTFPTAPSSGDEWVIRPRATPSISFGVQHAVAGSTADLGQAAADARAGRGRDGKGEQYCNGRLHHVRYPAGVEQLIPVTVVVVASGVVVGRRGCAAAVQPAIARQSRSILISVLFIASRPWAEGRGHFTDSHGEAIRTHVLSFLLPMILPEPITINATDQETVERSRRLKVRNADF